MRIDMPQRARRPLSLTSLIDVIFLLLLFFMLSSTFTRFAKVEIRGGGAGASLQAKRPDILIALRADRWAINGVAVDRQEAGNELRRLKQAGARSALLTVGDDLSSQTLVGAIEKIRRDSGLALTVAH